MNTTKIATIAAALTMALTSACGSETQSTEEAGSVTSRQQASISKGSADALERRLAAKSPVSPAYSQGSADAIERRLAAKSPVSSAYSQGSADAIERRTSFNATERQRCYVSADAAERRGPDACRR